MQKQPGWLYVGDGWLRYRDIEGWTDHFLLAESIRGFDWPPAAPASEPEAAHVSGAGVDARQRTAPSMGLARVRGLLRARGRQPGRHRAVVRPRVTHR